MFELAMVSQTVKGTWSFDPKLSEVQLVVDSKKMDTWVAYLDQSGPKLELYMANREAAEVLRSSSGGGKPSGRIVLKKR